MTPPVPHLIRKARQREMVTKAQAEQDTARKVAIAVSLATSRAEKDKAAEVEALKAENAELQERVEIAERKAQ